MKFCNAFVHNESGEFNTTMVYPSLNSSIFARLMNVWCLLKQEFPRDRDNVMHRSCPNFKCEVSHVKKSIAIDFLVVLHVPMEYEQPISEDIW